MKAIVFGAGKIARGFIGQLLYLSKADITFVDIDQQLVDRLNKDQKYHVYILGDSSLDSDVTGFQAVQLEDEKRIGAALVEADIAFVSVGGANLKSLGEKIGRIYKENGIPKKPFNFVTCENWRHAGAFLYEGITAEMEEQEKTMFDQLSCALRPSPVMNLQCRMQQVYGYRITGIFPSVPSISRGSFHRFRMRS